MVNLLCRDRFREDAAALKAAWDAQITQMSKETVSKDFQIHTLQEEEMKLKAQVARFQQDIDRSLLNSRRQRRHCVSRRLC